MRADVARIRDRAREMRVELKRHSKDPNWPLVQELIIEPLAELQQRIDEEIARKESRESRVPIDRDPVPSRYADALQKYYERLGSGQ